MCKFCDNKKKTTTMQLNTVKIKFQNKKFFRRKQVTYTHVKKYWVNKTIFSNLHKNFHFSFIYISNDTNEKFILII